jgi:hypothetical protein
MSHQITVTLPQGALDRLDDAALAGVFGETREEVAANLLKWVLAVAMVRLPAARSNDGESEGDGTV